MNTITTYLLIAFISLVAALLYRKLIAGTGLFLLDLSERIQRHKGCRSALLRKILK